MQNDRMKHKTEEGARNNKSPESAMQILRTFAKIKESNLHGTAADSPEETFMNSVNDFGVARLDAIGHGRGRGASVTDTERNRLVELLLLADAIRTSHRKARDKTGAKEKERLNRLTPRS